MQILQHQHERTRRALRADELFPRALHLIAHQDGIAARDLQLQAGIGLVHAEHLREELRDARAVDLHAGEPRDDS